MPDRFAARYLTAHTNLELLKQQVDEFKPRAVALVDPRNASVFKKMVGDGVEVVSGEEGLTDVVTRDDVDIVLSALVGFAGLRPTVAAIRHRKTIALANKETLVVAGEIITALLHEYSVRLLPVDSEHSAILQCLQGEQDNPISRLILTASGGPFHMKPGEEFESITVDQALSHPTWKMGKKITIDSATLMNKGLEVIEAHWLFNLPADRIQVVIHPQSIIHSMVEFIDGSIKAQLGLPDMKIPIQYAFTFPERLSMNGARLDFPTLKNLTFFEPDRTKFRCLQLAYDALALGGTAPAVLNAANEVSVAGFLERKISFLKIPELIERALSSHHVRPSPDLEDIIEADSATRQFIAKSL